MTPPFRSISTAATGTAALAAALAYPFLRKQVATHFDAEGRPDRYRSRMIAAVQFPVMMLGIQVLNDRLGTWPGSQDRDDRESGVRARDEAIAATELGLLTGQFAILATGLGLNVDMNRVNRAIQGALMLALGNVLPKLPRNALIGIRTPWTLADPAVWERTHRLGGYLLAGAGVVSLASLPVGKRGARLPLVATLIAIGVSAAYSFVAYMRLADSRG